MRNYCLVFALFISNISFARTVVMPNGFLNPSVEVSSSLFGKYIPVRTDPVWNGGRRLENPIRAYMGPDQPANKFIKIHFTLKNQESVYKYLNMSRVYSNGDMFNVKAMKTIVVPPKSSKSSYIILRIKDILRGEESVNRDIVIFFYLNSKINQLDSLVNLSPGQIGSFYKLIFNKI